MLCWCWAIDFFFFAAIHRHSASAFFVITTLKNLSRDGRTVIASIHQPCSEVFDLFDNLFLLSHGQTIFFGEAAAANEVLHIHILITLPNSNSYGQLQNNFSWLSASIAFWANAPSSISHVWENIHGGPYVAIASMIRTICNRRESILWRIIDPLDSLQQFCMNRVVPATELWESWEWMTWWIAAFLSIRIPLPATPKPIGPLPQGCQLRLWSCQGDIKRLLQNQGKELLWSTSCTRHQF